MLFVYLCDLSDVIMINICIIFLLTFRKGGKKTEDEEEEVVKPVLYASRLGAR